MAYGTHDDVAARIPTGTACDGEFSATTKPTADQVTVWVAEVSARLDGWIRKAGYDPTTMTASGKTICTEAVTEFVAGQVERYTVGREAESAFGSDAQGGERRKPLRDLLDMLEKRAADAATMLGITATSSSSTSGSSLASFHTDSEDKDDVTVVPARSFTVTGKM